MIKCTVGMEKSFCNDYKKVSLGDFKDSFKIGHCLQHLFLLLLLLLLYYYYYYYYYLNSILRKLYIYIYIYIYITGNMQPNN